MRSLGKLVREISIKRAIAETDFRAHRRQEWQAFDPDRPAAVPRFSSDLEQAVEFSKLAPNMIVKIPATSAGIPAIEEATYRGVSINATVSFTLPQAIAVAEAVERGLKRRETEGKEIATMGPVCTIMVGPAWTIG